MKKGTTYEPRPGECVDDTITAMLEMARTTGETVTAMFNDNEIMVSPTDVASTVRMRWDVAIERQRYDAAVKRKEWEATPEGQEALRKAAEEKARVEAEVAAGVRPFVTVDAAAWAERVSLNSKDGYSACIIRFAARWAWLMEQKMAAGATVADCAKAASHEADVEGITGFMYGCAVCELAHAWVHGDALRRWHNIDTQIGDEGERANASGGVLNPAMLVMGK